MPLVNLQTNLKSLKFGNDRPGGGSSNQPYIKQDIPLGDLPAKSGPDFLLRNGFLAPVNAAEDVSRLTQMFFDLKSPNGPLFIAKENLLSRTAVKTEASYGPGYGGGGVNAGIYTPLSTIGQAAVGFSGTHLNLLGLDPTSPQAGVNGGGFFPGAGLNRYDDVVTIRNNEGDNRLLQLLENTDPVNILTYTGGPGSVVGVGETSIRYASGERTNTVKVRRTREETTGRTSEDFIVPIGASSEYTTLTGVSLTDSFIADAGYTNELNLGEIGTGNGNFATNADLTPATKVADKTYQTVRPSDRTTDSWVNPLTSGASQKFEEFGGQGLTNTISPDGGNTWDNTSAQSGTEANSLKVNPLLPLTGAFSVGSLENQLEGGIKINYDNAVNGITNQVLNSGVTLENNGVPYYAKTTKGELFNKVENTQLTEVASLPVSVVSPNNNLEGGVRVNFDNAVNGITNQVLNSGVTLENNGIPYYAKTTTGELFGKKENTRLTQVASLPVSVVSVDNNLEGGVRVNFDNAVGGITNQILNDGIVLENRGIPYYAKTTKGNLSNKIENTQLTEVASLPVSVVSADNNLEGGVRINYSSAISSKGVSKVYNSNPLFTKKLNTDYENSVFRTYYSDTFLPTPRLIDGNSATYTMGQLDSENLNEINKKFSSPVLTDFRDKAANNNVINAPYIMGSYKDYAEVNKDKRLKMGTPGARRNVASYKIDAEGQSMLDQVNGSGVQWGKDPDFVTHPDLVNFAISVIDNSSTASVLNTMHFRAFIDSFSDKFTSEWGNTQYVGRADKFYSYKGFDRSISLGFTVYAQSKKEISGMYEKLNYLASTTAPSYANGGFMKGNLMRITVGDYVKNQLGICKGFSYDIPNEFSWDIGIDDEGNAGGTKQLPFGMKVVSFDFIPIQEFVPQVTTESTNTTYRYISQ